MFSTLRALMDASHKGSRRVYSHALPIDLCRELVCIHRSLAVVGYRPHVQSLTLYELVLSRPQLLPAVAKARQIIWDAVEEQFGLQCQVWPETTSLINWTAGASIGWHHDANRPYLAARHFSAVAYLNTQGSDFEGGTFCFQSGATPLRVQPTAGSLLVYTADDSNVHSVEEVTAGERSTLTMWFTLDPDHQEDPKVLSKLQSCVAAGLPPTMYLTDSGLDIRVLRLQQRLGVTITSATQHSQQPVHDSQDGSCHDGESGSVFKPCCLLHSSQSQHTTSCFSSLQEGLMAVALLEWLADSTPIHCAPNSQTASTAGIPCKGSGDAPACRSCALLELLPQAVQRLEVYLAAAENDYERLLPVWLQLGALVAPDKV